MPLADVTLDDKYTADSGRVYLSGIQALVRLPMMQHAREECRSAGCYKLTLSSGLPREGAHRFYDSLGFERHGYSFLMRL